MSTVTKIISAKTTIINHKYKTTYNIADKETEFTLDEITGTDRIKKFLYNCSIGKGNYYLEKIPYIVKYAKRYKLINESLKLESEGVNFINLLSEDSIDNIKIALFLKKLLRNNNEGCGEWILNKNIHEEYYIFEATNETDASYRYVMFLYDLGLIEKISTPDDNDIYFCKRTDLGQELCRIIIEDRRKDEANNTLLINYIDSIDKSDNSIKVDNSIIEKMKGGKNNG